MGHNRIHPVCCVAHADLETAHDPDCDAHPANIRARAERVAPEAAAVWFGPPPAPTTSAAVSVRVPADVRAWLDQDGLAPYSR